MIPYDETRDEIEWQSPEIAPPEWGCYFVLTPDIYTPGGYSYGIAWWGGAKWSVKAILAWHPKRPIPEWARKAAIA